MVVRRRGAPHDAKAFIQGGAPGAPRFVARCQTAWLTIHPVSAHDTLGFRRFFIVVPNIHSTQAVKPRPPFPELPRGFRYVAGPRLDFTGLIRVFIPFGPGYVSR